MAMETYSLDEVEDLVSKLERAGERQRNNIGQIVRLRAAERDLLKHADSVREMISTLIKGDKQHLLALFDGESTFLPRLRAVVDLTELSEFNSKCDNMTKLDTQVTILEELMAQIGKGFRIQAPKRPPESVTYPGWSAEAMQALCPGSPLDLVPEVKGTVAEALEWKVQPLLPASLVLDSLSGHISGELLSGVDVIEKIYTITASNAAGSASTSLTFSVREPAPTALVYSGSAAECITGDRIRWTATLEGGRPLQFEISPALPLGLTLDARSGAVAGVALKSTPLTKYTITASNSSGSASVELEFQVKVAPPVSLSYPEVAPLLPYGGVVYLTPEVDLKRVATSIEKAAKWGRIFSSSGGFVGTKWGKARQVLLGHMIHQAELPELSFAIEPGLPPGLCFAARTGVISGKPEKETTKTRYKVTVGNEGGSVSTHIIFGIKMEGPKGLLYPDVKSVLIAGESVSIEPEVQGIVYGWYTRDELPEGLKLDPSMGTICGTPSAAAPERSYTVVARNSAGEASTKVTFAVQRMPPKNLCYREMLFEYPVGRPVDIRPTFEGEVTKFIVEPSFPAGLRLDPELGTITGTPSVPTEASAYVVTASNESGSTSAYIGFSISVLPPEELSYPQVDDEYGVGERVDLEPKVSGGPTIWTVDPPLPDGIELDPATGLIRGTPTCPCEERAYTIAAENEAGGTCAVIRFRIASRSPEGLTYPEAGGEEHLVGTALYWEPRLSQDFGANFAVDPPLPEGLDIDQATGLISGTTEAACTAREYTVTAQNLAGSTTCVLRFAVVEPEPEPQDPEPQQQEDGKTLSYAAILDGITKVKDLPKNPSMTGFKSWDWMLWMVHRVHLDDPTLEIVDFTNAGMPLPHVEPRIAPKLMKAMITNTHVKSLLMSNCNLRKPQGSGLAEALKQNKTLEILNVESNYLDSDKIQQMAQALIENPNSGLTTWRFDTQKDQAYFGRCVEETVATLVQKNKQMLRIGFQCKDQHWLNVINRSLMANADIARRGRKALKADQDGGDAVAKAETEKPREPEAVARSLAKIELAKTPEKAAWEIFDDGDAGSHLLRKFIAEKTAFPSKDHLQKFAKANGKSMSYKEIAGLLIDFRTRLLGAFLEREVTLYENVSPFVGVLRKWDEKNDRFSFDLWTKDGGRFNFTSQKQPQMEVSADVAEWIAPEEKRLAEDGSALTFDEFVVFYGEEEARAKWNEASSDW